MTIKSLIAVAIPTADDMASPTAARRSACDWVSPTVRIIPRTDVVPSNAPNTESLMSSLVFMTCSDEKHHERWTP